MHRPRKARPAVSFLHDRLRCTMNLDMMLLALLLVPGLYAQVERTHARSMVISQTGIVATSQVLASQAAAQILAKGGSAVDAAITANAVLSVIEPGMCGIGGDLFVIYREAKTRKLYGLN